MTKTCTKCHEHKPLSEYHRDISEPSGYRSECKVCKRAADLGYVRRSRRRANSFTPEEVDAAMLLINTLLRRAPVPEGVLRSKGLQGLARKFARMRGE